ncbi:MAG: type VI secretion system contractile sheath large subunit [Nitrospira sp.]|nr:type VI secretion system contractile sheath large subunit [Nitrospira sp.]
MAETQETQSTKAPVAAAETSLIEQMLKPLDIRPQDEVYSDAKRALEELIRHLLAPERKDMKVNQAMVADMIAEMDKKLSAQVDAILHQATFQKLESAWRGLKLAVDRTNFRENIQFEMLNVSKEELLTDFVEAPDITKSALYKHMYTAEFGQFGGNPIGALIANYEFGPGPQDVKLLQYVSSVATMAHAPFVAAAGPKFFGMESYLRLPNLRDLKTHFEGPQYTKWNAFRDSEDSRSVGLCVPRFLLRLPYGQETNPAKMFNYNESLSNGHESYLWGNMAFAFATRLTESFARSRWYTDIIGPSSGGTVDDLPVHVFEAMGGVETKIPTEILISGEREKELADAGFIALTMRKGSDNACFFSANSSQRPKTFGQSAEGKVAEANYRLGTQLPYLFIINRLAHYIKVLQTEKLGGTKDRADLERELNTWISQYVSAMDVVTDEVSRRRPLRDAQVTVSDVEGNPGWYRVDLKVVPHIKYMGAFFTLSLVGKLDKKK